MPLVLSIRHDIIIRGGIMMAKNYMADVTKMLGVEFEHIF